MKHNSNEFPQGVALVIGGSGGVGAAVCCRLADPLCQDSCHPFQVVYYLIRGLTRNT
ncbi:MAG: hypothetical protein K0U59_03280 [Gammaproteobacteria bacterium]|nr:hypothetical protein [Gammaproteobacteria bacterium]